MTDFVSLLPPNSTPFERALEATLARPLAVDHATLWNPQLCPPSLLPQLAWSLSVHFWRDTWSLSTKRAAIAAALPAHGRRGTIASVRAGIADFGIEASFVEGWQTGAGAFTFRVLLSIDDMLGAGLSLDANFAATIGGRVMSLAPARCRFVVAYAQFVRPGARIAADVVTKDVDRGDRDPRPRPAFANPSLRTGAITRPRTRIVLAHDPLRRAA